jgi:hypothetical protein
MPCQTIESILPVSSLGFGAVDQLIQKIPQVKPGKTKSWQELQKIVGVMLWLSNPSNLAALKQIIDSLGTLEGLMLLANLLSYAGMDGIIDFGKLGSSLAGVKDAFDCITQNINAIMSVENQVINTVQGVLTTSNIFAMLGMSQVMERLGITDSYAFSQLSSEMTSKLGFASLTNIPGINGVLPVPPNVTQAEQTFYSVNSLTQTIYLLSQTPTNPVAQTVLQKTAQAASIVAPSVAAQQIGTLPEAPAQTILSAVSKGTDTTSEIMAQRSNNAAALATLSATAQSVPAPAPASVPTPPIPSPTGGLAPMGVATAQALASQGPVAIGNLQDAADKTAVLIGGSTEVLLWRRRQVQFLLKKYKAEFYQVDKDLKEIASMGAQAPLTTGSGALDLIPLLSILQSRNPALLERYRVLDFKIKNLQHDLDAINAEYSTSQSNVSQLQTYSNALQQFSPTNTRPYTGSDPRTAVNAQGCMLNGTYSDSCQKELQDPTNPNYDDSWLSPSQQETAKRLAVAAQQQGVPVRLAVALGLTEGSLSMNPGTPQNPNGTVDIGPLQINSSHVGNPKPGGGTITLADLWNPDFNISYGINYLSQAYNKSKSMGFTGEELIRNTYLGYNSGLGAIGTVSPSNANVSRFVVNYLKSSGCCVA